MTPLLQSIIIIFISSAITFLCTWFWGVRRKAEEVRAKEKELQEAKNQSIFNRIVELEKQAAVIQNLIGPLSIAFQTVLVKELTHFHTPEMDALLEKLGPPYSLSILEEQQLDLMLKERMTNLTDIPESEREAALMLPYIMKRVRRESITLKNYGFR